MAKTKTKTVKAWAIHDDDSGQLCRCYLAKSLDDAKSACYDGETPVRVTLIYTLPPAKPKKGVGK